MFPMNLPEGSLNLLALADVAFGRKALTSHMKRDGPA